MQKQLQELIDAYDTHAPYVTALKGAIRRLRPDTIERDARRQLDELKKSNEAIRRLPATEHRRILNDIRGEIQTSRSLAAGVALHKVGTIPALAQHAREFVASARRNTEFNFPSALDGITADGTVAIALLRIHMTTQLETATAAHLFERYSAALNSQTAAGLVEAEIIESLVQAKGARLATSEEDRAAAHQLREKLSKISELRVPLEVPEFDQLENEIAFLAERAAVVKVRPIDPTNQPAAALAFEQENDAMTEEGNKGHADYVREAQRGTAAS